MLKVSVKKKKDRRPLNNLIGRIKNLHERSVSIGYFKEQGLHRAANMSYANLLYIHAFGLVAGAPVRDVISNIKPFINGGGDQKLFFSGLLKEYFKKGSRVRVNEVLDSIGRKYMQDGKAVFGNPTILQVTNNPTPLIDTSELRDNFAYKTSISMTVVNR